LNDEELTIRAGELKKDLKIALPDCYVIAAAEKVGGVVLFSKIESEMENEERYLKEKRSMFIEEIS